MKHIRPFILASTASVAVIVGMFVFQSVMERRATAWAEMDRVIPLHDHILFDITAFWAHFWILLIPFIFGLPLLVALLVVALRRTK